ncbi:ATP-binding cassette domain-containing protein [Priestia aryabhattai]|uniref:ATP-binding cassette domain-containing protein n=1 Tax=Priestia TaxID=2800373 RepID=UPI001FB2A135|nr:ATP-binding cassette domain-containing protein [Priestia aryabhattai]MED3951504.1 ATP-binding cassette domain-containing protein [Priestia aryabhattai]
MIILENVNKKYDNKSILSNFSLNVDKGEFVSIIGPSGSGKTTILNLIGLLDSPESGNVRIDKYMNPNKKETVYLRRYIYGYIFQNYVLMENETVSKNLLISKAYNQNFTQEMMAETLESVGLSSAILNKKVYQLSGGEQQRVSIARVMLKPCKIILADEPTGNLDNSNKDIIISLFHYFKKVGKTIVCVTHDKEVAGNSDRIITLN